LNQAAQYFATPDTPIMYGQAPLTQRPIQENVFADELNRQQQLKMQLQRQNDDNE
jgi:hypothetical protein